MAQKQSHRLESNKIHHVIVRLNSESIFRGKALTDYPADEPFEFLLMDVPYDERALRFTIGNNGTHETIVRPDGGKRINYRYIRTGRSDGFLASNDNSHNSLTVNEGVETTFTWRTDCGNPSLDVNVTMHVYFLPSRSQIQVEYYVTK